jgi:iron complex outermembrane receptor protein
VETWGSYRISDWWRLSAGYNYMKIDLRTRPGSTDTTSVATGTDPSHQFSLRSSMNLSSNVEFDLALRTIAELPNPRVPGYTALDMRIGWRPSKNLEISLTGSNLLDSRHAEFNSSPGLAPSELNRSFYLGATWKF